MTKPRYHHGDLRRALIEDAAALLAGEGLDRLSLRGLARRAGVTPTAVYRHFASKEQLLGALAAEGHAGLAAQFETALAALAGAPPLDRLRALGVAYVEFTLHNTQMFRLMFRESAAQAAPALDGDAARRAFDLLAGTVAELCGPDAGPEALAGTTIAAWSLAHGYALLTLDGMLDWLPPEQRPDIGHILSSVVPVAAGQAVAAAPFSRLPTRSMDRPRQTTAQTTVTDSDTA